MKIAVITPNFTIAGVPLAQIRFARALANRGHEVELVIGYIDPSYTFPSVPEITIRHLNKRNARGMFLPMIKYFKDNKPDVVFSAEDQLNAFVLLAAIISRTKAKISCSSRVTPFDTYPKRFFSKGTLLKQLMKVVMPRADALTCVSSGMVSEYRKVFKSPPHVCVFNIVDSIDLKHRLHESIEDPWLLSDDGVPRLVAAGRLAPWKGFENLILAMKELLKTRQARLLILGDGPSRVDLEKMIKDNDLENHVKLTGYVDNPLKYFHHSDVYVLSSRLEGMGNVLIEAMMCGCTVVSTDCPTGPRELLADGKYGFLVPVDNPILMAEAIAYAIDAPIPEHILMEAIKPFTANAIINRHFELLGIESNADIKT